MACSSTSILAAMFDASDMTAEVEDKKDGDA
jgi:hypothetical protein